MRFLVHFVSALRGILQTTCKLKETGWGNLGYSRTKCLSNGHSFSFFQHRKTKYYHLVTITLIITYGVLVLDGTAFLHLRTSTTSALRSQPAKSSRATMIDGIAQHMEQDTIQI